MINIKTDPMQAQRIVAGDVIVLKQVIEAEVLKATIALKEVTAVESFRFHQGSVQALEAVMKLLP